MRWINSIIPILAISILLNSCKDNTSAAFYAGKTDDVLFIDFEPDIAFPPGNNIDSIDINQDSKYELFFETKDVPGATGFVTVPAVRATQDLNILIGGDHNMPKALSNGEIISSSDKWCTNDTLLLLSYCEGSYGHCTIIGYWANQQNKYLGFKYKNKLGWIKMSTNQILILKEFGIEK